MNVPRNHQYDNQIHRLCLKYPALCQIRARQAILREYAQVTGFLGLINPWSWGYEPFPQAEQEITSDIKKQ
jgi:hypothetical protein